MKNPLTDETVDFGGDLGANPAMQMQMAGMFLGPILSDPETVDGIRDQMAATLENADIDAVTLHRRGAGTERHKITLTPHEIAEIFINRVAQEFGFSIPGYTTLNTGK